MESRFISTLIVLFVTLSILAVAVVLGTTRAENAGVRYYSEIVSDGVVIYTQSGYEEMARPEGPIIVIFPPACKLSPTSPICQPIQAGYAIDKTVDFAAGIGCWQANWPGKIESCEYDR